MNALLARALLPFSGPEQCFRDIPDAIYPIEQFTAKIFLSTYGPQRLSSASCSRSARPQYGRAMTPDGCARMFRGETSVAWGSGSGTSTTRWTRRLYGTPWRPICRGSKPPSSGVESSAPRLAHFGSGEGVAGDFAVNSADFARLRERVSSSSMRPCRCSERSMWKVRSGTYFLPMRSLSSTRM